MRKYHIITLIFTLLITTSCILSQTTLASENNQNDKLALIDEYVAQEMESYDIPGLSLGIVHGDKIIYTKGYGIANEKKEPVTADTPFYIGSIGKTFTALAIRQLESNGKLNIKDTIQHYLPWFTLTDTNGTAITIENLLQHTSGLTTSSGNLPYAYNPDDSIEQLVQKINRNEKINRPVGSTYEYSNLNYVILGLIVETVSGVSYEDYITKYIFKPMSMESSYASITKAKKNNLAQGYRNILGFNIPLDCDYPVAQVPAGFQLSTANDMSKYIIYNLNNGYSNNISIIPNNSLEAPKYPFEPYLSSQSYYGLDWGISKDPVYSSYNRFYRFLGATPNFNAALLISQNHRYGVIVLINQRDSYYSPNLTGDIIGNGITDILLGKGIPASIDRDRYYKQWIPLIVMLILIVLLIYACTKFRKKIRTTKRKLAYVSMILLNFLLPILLLVFTPLYYDNHWKFFLTFNLEFTFPIFTLIVLQLLLGLIKLYMILAQRFLKKNSNNVINITP